MTRLLAIAATAAVGALIAFQPPVNSQLARYTSVLGAAFLSTAVSVVLVGVLFFSTGGAAALKDLGRIPILYYTGGLLGAALVTVSLVTVRELGAGGVVAATVSAQLVVSAVLDALGVLGLTQTSITPTRLLGFALLIAGTALVTLR